MARRRACPARTPSTSANGFSGPAPPAWARARRERTLGVSRRTQRRWAQRLATGAALAPTPLPGRVRTITEADEAHLRAQVAAHPDATLAMHCAQWAAARKTPVSPATMSRTLTRLELPLKKRR